MTHKKDIKIHRKDHHRFNELERTLSIDLKKLVPNYLTTEQIDLGEDDTINLIEARADDIHLLADLEFMIDGVPNTKQLHIPLI